EYGIRDFHVTGVQTCALPICIIPNLLKESAAAAGIDTDYLTTCWPVNGREGSIPYLLSFWMHGPLIHHDNIIGKTVCGGSGGCSSGNPRRLSIWPEDNNLLFARFKIHAGNILFLLFLLIPGLIVIYQPLRQVSEDKVYPPNHLFGVILRLSDNRCGESTLIQCLVSDKTQ